MSSLGGGLYEGCGGGVGRPEFGRNVLPVRLVDLLYRPCVALVSRVTVSI